MLPVPLIFPVPVKVRFSTPAGRVVVALDCKVSLIVTMPVFCPGINTAPVGLESVTPKVSSVSK